jgi:Arc/MetJ-type ribon-helix-helix transcriptional regulator
MAKTRAVEVRRKEAESEKITINLGYVDLGHIDLLVQEGFYSNRTDFIRTAIRNHLSSHGDVLKQTVARRSMVLGLQRYTREDLNACGRRRAAAHPGAGPRVD